MWVQDVFLDNYGIGLLDCAIIFYIVEVMKFEANFLMNVNWVQVENMMCYNSSLLFVFPKEYGEKEGKTTMLVIGSLFVSFFVYIFTLFYFFSGFSE